MKKILFFVLILISFKGFSQSTVLLRGDTIKVYKQGGTATLRVDSILMLTKYRQGSSNDSILTWDASSKTVKMRNAADISTIPNLQQVTDVGRRTTNTMHVYNGATDSLILAPTSVSVINNSGGDAFFSPGYIYAQNALGVRWVAGNEFGMRNASTAFNTGLRNIDPSASNELYLRQGNSSAIDTIATLYDIRNGGGGSGTINSGTTGKPAYYVGATTLDDFAAVDYATSGTNVLITTQNTTDVGLEIKAQSSQSANLLNVSSSSGTGDILKILGGGNVSVDNGTLLVDATNNRVGIGETSPQTTLQVGEDGGVASSFGTGAQLFFTNNGGNTYITGRGASSAEVFFGAENAKGVMGMLSNHPYDIRTNNTTRMILQAAGELTINTHMEMVEQSAPSTPSSGYVKIYPKSDGLWYGKDDAGVESRLSNLIQSKGLTLESPGSAEDFGMWKTQVAITVSSINAVVKGSSPSVTINIAFGSDITSLTNVFSSGTAITNTTTGQTINSGFNDATIPAGSWIRLISTASSGTITQIEVTINYTED